MANRNRFAILWLLIAGVFVSLPLLADGSQFGTITGKLKDESGAPIPGVSMELTSDEKGFRRSVVTDAEGSFNFPQLLPGTYTVRAELAGFESIVSTTNVVAAERTTTVALTLKLVPGGRRPSRSRATCRSSTRPTRPTRRS